MLLFFITSFVFNIFYYSIRFWDVSYIICEGITIIYKWLNYVEISNINSEYNFSGFELKEFWPNYFMQPIINATEVLFYFSFSYIVPRELSCDL